ncbi:hypothetical protein F5Y08DRAFT_196648 [Xylaria arbuscula]|nr:hypothetical protein F5Y08DRAFT_196648 [Xylaria arbuscula]
MSKLHTHLGWFYGFFSEPGVLATASYHLVPFPHATASQSRQSEPVLRQASNQASNQSFSQSIIQSINQASNQSSKQAIIPTTLILPISISAAAVFASTTAVAYTFSVDGITNPNHLQSYKLDWSSPQLPVNPPSLSTNWPFWLLWV